MKSKNVYKQIVFSIIICNCLLQISLIAQDIHFSQFRESPMLVNPAQTALNRDIRIIINYKDQWRSVTAPYKTFAFSGEYAFNQIKNKRSYLALGVQLYNDKAGDAQMGTTEALLALSGTLKISEKQKISLGLIGGWAQRTMNFNALKWESQYDGNSYNAAIASGESNVSNSYNYVDAGAGIVWNYGKEQKTISVKDGVNATIGVSAFHFGLPNYSFNNNATEKLNTKIIAHANMEIPFEKARFILIPELMYVNQHPFSEINGGALFKFLLKEQTIGSKGIKASAFSLGAHHRYKDAMIFTILYEYANYSIGISYDVNTSRLSAASNLKGGFEIALRFVTPNPHQKRASTASF